MGETGRCTSALRLIAVIPDFKLSTGNGAAGPPEKVSHMDARYNLSRAALFSASLLQGKYENIRIAVEDRLHQPYRMKLIHHAQEVFAPRLCTWRLRRLY